MKRVISIIAVLLLTVGLFAGCGGKSGQSSGASSENTAGTITDDIFSTDDVKYLDEYGDAVYRIVRTESGNSAAGIVLKKLRDTFSGDRLLYGQLR